MRKLTGRELLSAMQVYKLFIVVELLMGDIPERSVFRQPVLKRALVPYLQIVQGRSTNSRRCEAATS